jgi:hypothetical protein
LQYSHADTWLACRLHTYNLWQSDADGDTDSNSNSNSNGYCNCKCYGNSYSNANDDCYGYSYCYSNRYGSAEDYSITKTPPHSAASTVRLIGDSNK